MKIKSKIVSLVLVAAIVPILIMGISSYILGLKTSLRTTEIFYQGALNQGASSFNSYFSSVNKKLGLFSKDYASTLGKNIDTQILVNNLGEGEETYINSYIGTADKKFVIYPQQAMPAGYDPTARPWYKSAIGKEFAISEPYEDANTKQFMISVAKEVKVNGQTLGVASIDIDFAKLNSYIENIHTGNRGFIAIIDKTGLILFHNNKELMGKNFGEVYNKEYLDNVLSNEKFEQKIPKDKIMTFSKNIEGSTLFLVLGRSEVDVIKDYASTRNINIGILVFAVLVSILALVVTNKSIINPINSFGKIFKKGTNGELNEQIHLTSKDELEDLANDYNGFVTILGETVRDIKDLSVKVSSENEIVSDSITALINGNSKIKGITDLYQDIEHVLDKVRNQTASSEESLAAAEEISKNGKDLLGNMEHMLKDLDNTLHKAKESYENINKVGKSIIDISQESEATSEEVSKLYNMSQGIGTIITAITSIAERTNLLALNAAIESARAGEAGRGFAVVADEIRKLAEQTNRETDKISEMISSIQSSVDAVKDKGQVMQKKVTDSTILSEESQKSIAEIMDLTDKNNSGVKALSNAVNDQIYASSEIMTAVNHIAENSIEIEELCTNTTHIAANIKKSMNKNLEIIEDLKNKSKSLEKDLEFFKV